MKAEKDKVLRLLKTARGQMDGIIKMVEDDRYCVDVSNQLMACQAVIKCANSEIIKAHMQCCVMEALSGGDKNADKHISELTRLFEKLNA